MENPRLWGKNKHKILDSELKLLRAIIATSALQKNEYTEALVVGLLTHDLAPRYTLLRQQLIWAADPELLKERENIETIIKEDIEEVASQEVTETHFALVIDFVYKAKRTFPRG